MLNEHARQAWEGMGAQGLKSRVVQGVAQLKFRVAFPEGGLLDADGGRFLMQERCTEDGNSRHVRNR